MKSKRDTNHTLREHFNYWVDNHMARGSLGLIHILIISSVLFSFLMAGLIILLGFNQGAEQASVFWDSFATVINAWMPSFEDGNISYLLMMSLTAIAGLLFTSVLIGIITSTIEERILDLKKGNSLVLEKGHIVVLGFDPGEYALIHQLILAAEGKPECLVLAGEMEREDMEFCLKENLDIPKNFRIVCRTVDITDPASIEKCSIETCRTVIVSPTDDDMTTKAVLAVMVLMSKKGVSNIRINAILSKNQHNFPQSLAEEHNLTVLHTNEILAKMIAHSCTQAGLSETFREIFNFEGSEFYLVEVPELSGETFEEIMMRINYAVPSGVLRNREMILNPPANYKIQEGDRIIVFSEESRSLKLEKREVPKDAVDSMISAIDSEDQTDTVIIGNNETLPMILRELPENISQVYLVGTGIYENADKIDEVARARNLKVNKLNADIQSEDGLSEIARLAEHIVILNDHDQDPDEADMDVIFLLLNFRDLRSKYKLNFNITVEMQKERNQKLVEGGDSTDFLVASNMSSLILAQLAENPELMEVFREILSNRGNELYLKNASLAQVTGQYFVRHLRRVLLNSGYIFLGYVDKNRRSYFNLPLDNMITLTPEDDLIVLGEN